MKFDKKTLKALADMFENEADEFIRDAEENFSSVFTDDVIAKMDSRFLNTENSVNIQVIRPKEKRSYIFMKIAGAVAVLAVSFTAFYFSGEKMPNNNQIADTVDITTTFYGTESESVSTTGITAVTKITSDISKYTEEEYIFADTVYTSVSSEPAVTLPPAGETPKDTAGTQRDTAETKNTEPVTEMTSKRTETVTSQVISEQTGTVTEQTTTEQNVTAVSEITEPAVTSRYGKLEISYERDYSGQLCGDTVEITDENIRGFYLNDYLKKYTENGSVEGLFRLDDGKAHKIYVHDSDSGNGSHNLYAGYFYITFEHMNKITVFMQNNFDDDVFEELRNIITECIDDSADKENIKIDRQLSFMINISGLDAVSEELAGKIGYALESRYDVGKIKFVPSFEDTLLYHTDLDGLSYPASAYEQINEIIQKNGYGDKDIILSKKTNDDNEYCVIKLYNCHLSQKKFMELHTEIYENTGFDGTYMRAVQ